MPQGPIQDLVRLFVAFKKEGIIDHPHDRVEGIEGADRDDPHLDRVHLNLLQDFGFIADRFGMENLDIDISAGSLRHQLLEFLGYDILGRSGFGHHPEFDRHGAEGGQRHGAKTPDEHRQE